MNRRKTTRGWKCLSKSLEVRGSGFRIGRRGPPKTTLGWTLVPSAQSGSRRDMPNPDGLGESLSAFATRKAVLDELTRILTKD